MNSDLHDRLRPIGYNLLIAQAISRRSTLTAVAMRILEVHRDSVVVHDGAHRNGALNRCRPWRVSSSLSAISWPSAIGSLAETDSHGGHWLTARMAPVTQLARRASDGARQCLVSNVDTALLVMGLDGDHNLRRLERYLAMVQSAGVWPVVVLTKQDLADLGCRQDRRSASTSAAERSCPRRRCTFCQSAAMELRRLPRARPDPRHARIIRRRESPR